MPWRSLLGRRLAAVRRRLAITLPAALIVLVASAVSGMQSHADSAPSSDAGADSSISADGRSVGKTTDDAPELTALLAEEAAQQARTPQSAGAAGSIGSAGHARSIGINAVVLQAHRQAATTTARTAPACHLSWTLLAAIGEVESHNARSRDVSIEGDVRPAIYGPVLNGGPFASISDSDNGRYDADTVWDRAVGPMQFIPGTWARHGKDGNGDGLANPNNIFDASLSAAGYLCFGGRDLATPGGLSAAILSYNHSFSYVRTVLGWMQGYATGIANPVTSPAQVDEPARPVPTPTTRPAPTPAPSPSPSPKPSPSRSSSPTPSPLPTPSPSCSPAPDPSPSGSPSPSASPSPSGSPSPNPSQSGSPSPSPSPSGSPSPSPSPSPPCGP